MSQNMPSDINPIIGAGAEAHALCRSYRFSSSAYNEMCAQPGELRPHWEYVGRTLDALGLQELQRRYEEARRLLRDNDVTYNVYTDPKGIGRPWDLDLIPQLIESEEWSRIEAGLIQRAELLNLLLADIYGPRKLIDPKARPIQKLAQTAIEMIQRLTGIDITRCQRCGGKMDRSLALPRIVATLG